MIRTKLFHYFFFSVFILLLYQFWLLLSPFLAAILGAVILAVLFSPVHEWFLNRFPGLNRSFSAVLSTLVITTVSVIPIFFLGWFVFNESETFLPILNSWKNAVQNLEQGDLRNTAWLGKLQREIRIHFGVGAAEFRAFIVSLAQDIFRIVNQSGRLFARNAVLSIVQICIMIFTLFFLVRDGQAIWNSFLKLIPMRSHHKLKITQRLHAIMIEIVRGSLLTGLVQIVFATTGYLIAGVPAAATLGLLTGIAAFLPVIGSALIWLPIGFGLLFKGAAAKGLFVLLWGGLFISLLDNMLRPFLIRDKAQLPVLFLFFGFLGGFLIYGAKGIFIGPVVIILALSFTEIYQELYLRGGTDDQ